MLRAFIAISPDRSTRDAIAAVREQCRGAVSPVADRIRVSWSRDEALHLTVRFFEKIDEARVDELREALAPLISQVGEISIPLTTLGGFPRLAAPRVVWIGPPESWLDTAECRRLAGVVGAVDKACASLGFQNDDRRWRPHVTLARVKDGERLVGNYVRDQPVPPAASTLIARALTFYRSEPGPSGARHTPLWEEKLVD